MKLYYIANARIPHKKAYAIQIVKMCEAFIEAGVELELIIPKQKELEENIKKYYRLRTPIHVKRLPVLNWYASGRLGFFFSGISFMVSYLCYMISKRYYGEKGVIYTIDMDTFSFTATVFIGMPCFLETHGGKTATLINKIFFKYINGVIVINNIIKQQISKSLSFSQDKILVWSNGIDLNLFHEFSKTESREKLFLSKEIKIVMYSGRFYDWKGLSVLIDAASELPENIFVYVVGGSKEEFINITKIKQLPSNLIFSGEKLYIDMPIWLSAADALLVLGTKYDNQSYYYTSPMKIFEYLAMKRPIIASRTPALNDIVTENEVIFYEPDNYHDLAKKIILSVAKSDWIDNLTHSAFVKVQNFTWDKRAKDVMSFINKNI